MLARAQLETEYSLPHGYFCWQQLCFISGRCWFLEQLYTKSALYQSRDSRQRYPR